MKLAIVVGHNSASQGAVRRDTGESEFVWNGRLAAGTTVSVTGYGDIPVQGRPVDQINLIALGDTAKEMISAGVTTPVLPFRDATNAMHMLTPAQMAEMVRKAKAAASALYAAAWALKDADPTPQDYGDDSHWPGDGST